MRPFHSTPRRSEVPSRPRPFEAQTEMFFKISQTVQPDNCDVITTVMKISSKQRKSVEIRSG